MVIRVAEHFGSVCVDPDDGEALCSMAASGLRDGEKVHLDFTGVSILATLFLNSAIGCLYGQFSVDDLRQRLSWDGLDETDDELVRLVQANACRFFAASLSQQKRLVEAAGQSLDRC